MWCPDVRGVVTTEDGSKVLITMQGYNVPSDPQSVESAITATLTFGTSDERYRWLNRVIAVVEGERDRERNATRLRSFACVNELARGSPGVEHSR